MNGHMHANQKRPNDWTFSLERNIQFFKVYEGYKSHTNKGYTIQRWDTTQKLMVLVQT